MNLTCVLAGYNEAQNLEESVCCCLREMEKDFDEFELILVDDGSQDNSSRVMAEMANANSHVQFIPNLVNLNFGTSVLRGLVAAKYDYVIYNAMDLPLNPSLYADIIKDMDKCDLLVLERVGYNPTVWRKITSFMNQVMLWILFPGCMRGNPVVNYIQVFRKSCIQQILPLARGPIFVWPEMIFRAKYEGLRVKNRKTPVDGVQTRKGAFGKPHDILWGVYEMLRFRIRKWIGKI